MDQYNQIPRHDMQPIQPESSNSGSSQSNSHLYSLIHRLAETVDKQSRQIARLESTISEVRSTINNLS